jgi:predicted RNase H-like nuclease
LREVYPTWSSKGCRAWVEVWLAKAEAQLDDLKEVLELKRNRAEELRKERDRWASALEARQRQMPT